MKANKTLFSYVKQTFEIKKMIKAYVEAERYLINEAAQGNGVQYVQEFEPMTAEEFHQYETDGFGNIRNKTPKEVILQKMNDIALKAQKYLEEEKYELVQELKEIYERYKKEYDRL